MRWSRMANARHQCRDPGSGAANRTRTCDPVITNDVLYQLSYCGIKDLARRASDLGAS
jgi:hypothetical protein